MINRIDWYTHHSRRCQRNRLSVCSGNPQKVFIGGAGFCGFFYQLIDFLWNSPSNKMQQCVPFLRERTEFWFSLDQQSELLRRNPIDKLQTCSQNAMKTNRLLWLKATTTQICWKESRLRNSKMCTDFWILPGQHLTNDDQNKISISIWARHVPELTNLTSGTVALAIRIY